MLTKPMLTVHDAADFLRIKESTVRSLIHEKRLRAVKIGKEWRIAESDLERFLNRYANREPDSPGSNPASDSESNLES